MIEALSLYMSQRIKAADPEGSVSVNVMAYEIGRLINLYGTILLTIVLGWATGNLLESLLAMSGFAILRRFSGGAHMPTLMSCTIVSAAFFVAIPFVQISEIVTGVLTFLSFMTITWTLKETRKKAFFSGMIILSNLIILSPILALAYFVQTVTVFAKGGVEE